jgi:phospholipid/cholesterol/gamma-HCH transport system permease protein
METESEQCEIVFSLLLEDTLLVRLLGKWKTGNRLPPASEVRKQTGAAPGVRSVIFDTQELTGWDSGLLTFLIKVARECSRKNIHVEKDGLPQGVQRLLILASAVPEREGARKESARGHFLAQIGDASISLGRSTVEMIDFIGDAFLAFVRMIRGKAGFRPSDLFFIIQQCGVQALPIVSLISLLVGLILAFVGAVQLKVFGAQIYIASLVGIAMVRVMGAVMAGVVMAGRTGAAFAAQLGTMEVNEEIDALKTMGISPMEFLVLPRMLALVLMMPLLCVYADLMGILGGLIVGVAMFDLNVIEYCNLTWESVGLADFWIGLFQSTVYGVLVALAGCLRGMQCGRSASAVGDAATSAVVTGIVSIVVATAIITVICDVIGI